MVYWANKPQKCVVYCWKNGHLVVITAVNQINILQQSLQFKASRVAVAAIIFGDVIKCGSAPATAPEKYKKSLKVHLHSLNHSDKTLSLLVVLIIHRLTKPHCTLFLSAVLFLPFLVFSARLSSFLISPSPFPFSPFSTGHTGYLCTCINGYGCESLLGVTLRWTSITSRGGGGGSTNHLQLVWDVSTSLRQLWTVYTNKMGNLLEQMHGWVGGRKGEGARRPFG